MIRISRFVYIILFSSLLSASGLEENTLEDPEITEFVGVVKVKGNMPHSFLVLETLKGDEYILTGLIADEILKNYQYKKLRVLGNLVESDVIKKLSEIIVVDYMVIEE